jgi:hypothetical protein
LSSISANLADHAPCSILIAMAPTGASHANALPSHSEGNASQSQSQRKEKATPYAPNAIAFDAETAKFSGITADQLSRWGRAHPAIDVAAEILRAAVWLEANPKNGKVRSHP